VQTKVSIITATYNSSATIKDTLESIAKQTYHNIEHIIIDGASTDNTLAIVNNYPHISKIISEKDNGIYDAMNKGIDTATGEIIGILNSDDFYTNEKVIEDIVAIIRNANADGAYADLNYVNANNTSKIIRKWRSGNYAKKSFYYGWMPPHPTVFVKKIVYNKCGKFNLVMKSAADYEFIIRVFLKSNFTFTYLPKTIVNMRVGGVSSSNVKNRIRANKEDRLAWKMNDIKPYFFTLFLKPVRKVFQYL
jgi:glycosyltransferase